MPRRVLLVDDEVAFLLPMKKMLESSGLVVDATETYEQAMHLLTNRRYDAVIADVRLGGVMSQEGMIILDFIKKNLPETHVIIMTGYGGPEIMKEAYRLNAGYYFEKPVSFKKLSEALSELGVR